MSVTAIDLFAGLGGSTEGATQAGARVLWAANHWADAVRWHAANHPATVHACQDLHQADWRDAPAHDVLIASPCCQGHSRARGRDAPHHDAARSTAWAVVSCAEAHRPRLVVVENVPEFRDWTLYRAWRAAMLALGYRLSESVVDSADIGMAQSRSRLFLTAELRSARRPLDLPRRPARTAASVVDWGGPGWSPIHRADRVRVGMRPLSQTTVDRLLAGRAKHGERFLLPYYGTATARSADRPIGALTTRDRYAVVRGDEMRMLTVDEQREFMGFPPGYRLPPARRLATHLLGNAVCPPVMRAIVERLTR